MTDFNATFFFSPFSCTYDPVCCREISYQIAMNNTWDSMSWNNYTNANLENVKIPDSMLHPNFSSVNETIVDVTTLPWLDPNGYIPTPLPFNMSYNTGVNVSFLGTYTIYIFAKNEYYSFIYG